ncbi:MAG TPA: KGG domain-containing protein, partial [Edaphobacter sp.]|nr:KGG domain-containing protein [Edaphobacter sp.]
MIELRPKIGNPETLQLDRNGWVPNNQRLAVLIYHNVIDSKGKTLRKRWNPCFGAMIGRHSGAMVSIPFITIIRPHTDTSNRGFGSMDDDKQREIASQGGKQSGGNFKNDPQRAAEAGRSGGENLG